MNVDCCHAADSIHVYTDAYTDIHNTILTSVNNYMVMKQVKLIYIAIQFNTLVDKGC